MPGSIIPNLISCWVTMEEEGKDRKFMTAACRMEIKEGRDSLVRVTGAWMETRKKSEIARYAVVQWFITEIISRFELASQTVCSFCFIQEPSVVETTKASVYIRRYSCIIIINGGKKTLTPIGSKLSRRAAFLRGRNRKGVLWLRVHIDGRNATRAPGGHFNTAATEDEGFRSKSQSAWNLTKSHRQTRRRGCTHGSGDGEKLDLRAHGESSLFPWTWRFVFSRRSTVSGSS